MFLQKAACALINLVAPCTLGMQEICSYIKGSREALETDTGFLSLEQYLAVGKKRAPNFSSEDRQRVYPVFLNYQRNLQRAKTSRNQTLWQYDNMDLVAHLYRSFKARPYNGVPISFCYRDEVQVRHATASVSQCG